MSGGRPRELGGPENDRTNLVVAVGNRWRPVLDALGRIAHKRRISRSELVREVLANFAAREERRWQLSASETCGKENKEDKG
jgi:hypothetical protein